MVARVCALWVANCGKDRVGRGQQLAGAGQVGDVGVDLAGEDREALQPLHLGALDLAVPVGALDQADHQPVAAAPRQVEEVVQHEGGALLVGLHHEADAVPARQLRREAQRLQQVERDLQPVGLLRVDVQADVVAPRQHGQAQQARQQLVHHPVPLRARVARMQGGELDGDARALDRCRARRPPCRWRGSPARRRGGNARRRRPWSRPRPACRRSGGSPWPPSGGCWPAPPRWSGR